MNLDRIEQQAGHLPAYQIADSVNEALMESANLVITAPPGAGKSTLLPLTILRGMSDQALEGFIHDHLKSQGKILMIFGGMVLAFLAEKFVFADADLKSQLMLSHQLLVQVMPSQEFQSMPPALLHTAMSA